MPERGAPRDPEEACDHRAHESTLLSIVGGLIAPRRGAVLLDGEPIEGPRVDRGMVFQSYTLYQCMARACARAA